MDCFKDVKTKSIKKHQKTPKQIKTKKLNRRIKWKYRRKHEKYVRPNVVFAVANLNSYSCRFTIQQMRHCFLSTIREAKHQFLPHDRRPAITAIRSSVQKWRQSVPGFWGIRFKIFFKRLINRSEQRTAQIWQQILQV